MARTTLDIPPPPKVREHVRRDAILCMMALTLTDPEMFRAGLERERLLHAHATPRVHKQELGQYFTPASIADFMASLLPVQEKAEIRILDPGAGIGGLACAFLARLSGEKGFHGKVSVDAYEIDTNLLARLESNLGKSVVAVNGRATVHAEDFLKAAVQRVSARSTPRYSHVIMNPPYRKIRSDSSERGYARELGLETVNLYAVFVGAAIALTEDGGSIVAILPRSFCNGSYYKPFREFILKRCALERIHLFESRNSAFRDESVLQENVIILLRKAVSQPEVVRVSHSMTDVFDGMSEIRVPFREIVKADDVERYINIPLPGRAGSPSVFDSVRGSLADLGVRVSTGPVVDFRVHDALRKNHSEGCVPLLYPVHFRNHRIRWPVESKRPNALARTSSTERMAVPLSYYVVVKRFSAKEESKRIVASLVAPGDFPGVDALAFENHLNVFSYGAGNLDKSLAYGLTAWLNTTYLDGRFRLFSGHTQVNATDLRNLPYPTAGQLRRMGELLEREGEWSQDIFDRVAEEGLYEQ
ncbi:MAG: Eco57I restriction-modification methylase domain-containing protein [Kiritimatiellae bacterium]|nr:Eco57I restriction-modification methylase domain-containing protein [Kiritimatiellia bacterium]